MSARPRTIVLASRNRDKLREMQEICAGHPFEVVSALDFPGLPEVIEDGTSALGNATRKAVIAAAYTGEIAVADDTGFQVRVLGGLPDVFASRFAGEGCSYADNVDLVLDLLAGVPDEARDARFVTSMVWIDPRPAGGLGVDSAPPAAVRWLHDPFARSVTLQDRADDAEFWNGLVDRRRVWAGYAAVMRNLPVGWGADAARAVRIFDRLAAPFLGGGRPAGEPDGAMWLPDSRIWTAGGPDEPGRPATHVCPSGLPPEAPGRAVNGPVWLELSTEGRLLGQLGRHALGARGFGYDPIFVPVGHTRTLAELNADEKNAISHRGRALRRLMAAVGRVYEGA